MKPIIQMTLLLMPWKEYAKHFWMGSNLPTLD